MNTMKSVNYQGIKDAVISYWFKYYFQAAVTALVCKILWMEFEADTCLGLQLAYLHQVLWGECVEEICDTWS